MRGIINGVSDSRMSEIKEPSRKTKKLCAFTLAEVLITLAIIGVVAALTIPVVVSKYQKQQYYTQFMKVYNTLSNAIDLSKVDNGAVNTWSSARCSFSDCADFGDKYLVPFLKIAKACDSSNYKECVEDDIYELGGGNGSSEAYPDRKASDEWLEDVSRAYLLQDGSSVVVGEVGVNNGTNVRYVLIYVDANGTKEPNVIGRDVFLFQLTNEKFGPGYTYNKSATNSEGYAVALNCEPSDSESSGWGCADRLLQEGKMDY